MSFRFVLSVSVIAVVSAAACSVVNAPDDAEPPSSTTAPTGGSGGDTGGTGGTGLTGGSGGTGLAGGSGGSGGGSPAGCGDGTVGDGEQCDDGGTDADDGCDASCQVEGSCTSPVSIALGSDGSGGLVGSVARSTGGLSQVAGATCDGTAGLGAGSDRIYSFTLAEPSLVRVTVEGDFDLLLRVTTTACQVGSEVTEPGGDGDGCANGTGAPPDAEETLLFPTLAAGTYYVQVDGPASDDEGSFTLTVEAPRVPGCAEALAFAPGAPSEAYVIDPDGAGGNDPFQVYCDMQTAGGGWTVVYFVDAEHFDGRFANNFTASATPPLAINAAADIWNAEQALTFTQTLFACTTQDDAATYFWRYANTEPHTYFANTTTDYGYVEPWQSTEANGSPGGCFATRRTDPYGFLVIEQGDTACGTCSEIVYGMYHYSNSPGCNNTDSTYGQHNSPWDARSLQYPICNGTQTSNGSFWIAVR